MTEHEMGLQSDRIGAASPVEALSSNYEQKLEHWATVV
jgi:hypothetical protein